MARPITLIAPSAMQISPLTSVGYKKIQYFTSGFTFLVRGMRYQRRPAPTSSSSLSFGGAGTTRRKNHDDVRSQYPDSSA